MKIATYNDGSRDGQLVVVARELATAHYATGVAGRLQQVLDDWNFIAPQLEDLAQTLDHGKARHAFPFDPRRCGAPLPRAAVWAEADPGSASGVGLGRADALFGPQARLGLPDALPLGSNGLELRARIVLLTGDIGPRPEAGAALDGVRLLLLACSVHPRNGDTAGAAAVAAAFAPVALTPDELGDAWQAGRADLALRLRSGGRRGSETARQASPAPSLSAGELLQRAACWTGLRAGSLIACEAGAVLRLSWPDASGDRVQVEAETADGRQPFGAIEMVLR